MLISWPARTRQQVGSAALALLAAALIEAGWLGAAAQGLPASLGHRQPTAADAAGEPTEKKTPVSPQEAAMERAVNNFCRGCSPIIPVASVPRYKSMQSKSTWRRSRNIRTRLRQTSHNSAAAVNPFVRDYSPPSDAQPAAR